MYPMSVTSCTPVIVTSNEKTVQWKMMCLVVSHRYTLKHLSVESNMKSLPSVNITGAVKYSLI